MIHKDSVLKLPIENGYYALPPGKLATLTTYYERMGPFTDSLAKWPENVAYSRLGPCDTDLYRTLFRLVGENLLWGSRLEIAEAELIGVLSDPDIEAYVITLKGEHIGLLEIDFRETKNAEIVYIGVMPETTGHGIGRAMMDVVFTRSAARNVNRIWLHTCHFDTSHAAKFYEKSGFRAYQLAVEIMDDPRLTGALPIEAAPYIPLILSETIRKGHE
jgi:ribosomal protein S18 acetylase RimI-like enzyme